MTDQPLLTATLIAKNEKHNLRRCLDSLWPFCDEIVIVDTGSKDGTVAEAKRYAQRRGEPGKLKTKRFRWCDNFAAARQAADNIATGKWLVWADFDDTITGLKNLRQMAGDANDEVVAFFARYSYARDPNGATVSELWRERVVRNNGNQWQGRLHEHKLFTQGQIVRVPPETAEWVHHRDHANRTGERNLRILRQWDRDEPDNPRIVQSIAMELMGDDKFAEASDVFARYLTLPGEPPDRRAQATRHMCQMLMVQGRVEDARQAAFQSLAETWLWADTHLTLAEAEQTLGRPDVGLVHAQTALSIGQPDTLLIINPLQYTAHTRSVIAICLAQLGRLDDAMQVAQEALEIAPGYPLVTSQWPMWQAQLKRLRTLGTWIAAADQLLEVGELEKARALLDHPPFFIAEESGLIGKRVEVARLVAGRRAGPRVVVEDAAADAFIARHKEAA